MNGPLRSLGLESNGSYLRHIPGPMQRHQQAQSMQNRTIWRPSCDFLLSRSPCCQLVRSAASSNLSISAHRLCGKMMEGRTLYIRRNLGLSNTLRDTMNQIYVFLSPHSDVAQWPVRVGAVDIDLNPPALNCFICCTLNSPNTTKMTLFIFSQETGAVGCYAVSSHFISPWSQIF
jgi:hypothetical protein